MATKFEKCPVCWVPARIIDSPEGRDVFDVTCFRCGGYVVTRSARPGINLDWQQSANSSGWLRENGGVFVTTELVRETLLHLRTPSPPEKAIKLLEYLGRKFPNVGAQFVIEPRFLELLAHPDFERNLQPFFDKGMRHIHETLEMQSVIWGSSPEELNYVVQEILVREEKCLIDRGNSNFSISPKGWSRLDEIRRGTSQSETGFIAMSYDPTFDNLLNFGLIPGVRAAGYHVVVMKQVEHNNRIDDEIIAQLRQCRFLVGDFSKVRGGTYFEAGFALGLGRHVVWTCEQRKLNEKDAVHFDTRQFNFVPWVDGEWDTFARALQNRIERTIGKGPIDPKSQ